MDEISARQLSASDDSWWAASNDNPMNWSRGRKWAITLASCYMSSLISIAASAYSLGIHKMESDLHTSHLLATSGISSFTFAVAIFPLFLTPLGEAVGRRTVYLVSYSIFFLFFLPVALSKNIQTVLIARFICGAAGSVGSTMVGGTLSDIWSRREREVPMALFSLSALFGTPIGPVFFSWTGSLANWRWIHWTMLIAYAPSAILVFSVFNKETLHSVLRRRMSESEGKRDPPSPPPRIAARAARTLRSSVLRPFTFLISEPIVLVLSLWISFAWGTLYLFLESVPLVFAKYDFAPAHNTEGLSFVGLAVGALVGFGAHITFLRFSRRMSSHKPEARLPGACYGAPIFAFSFFFYAWTGRPWISWVVPQLATAILMCGLYLVYACIFMYLSECYGSFTSSALAAQSFSRNIFATAFPLFATTLYERLTYKWSSTLLGVVASLHGMFPFLLLRYGVSLRQRSKFASAQVGEQNRAEDTIRWQRRPTISVGTCQSR